MPRRSHKRKAQQQNDFLLFVVIVVIVLFAGITQTANLIELGGMAIAIVLAIGVTAIGIAIIIQQNRTQKQLQALRLLRLDDVDCMTGVQFEKYVAELFKFRGYQVKTTPATGDYGVDLVVTKNKIRTAVQLKCYTKPVGQEAVREAIAGMMHYNCSKSMVVTNRLFTPHAQALAVSNDCELIDRDQLAKWVAEFYSKKFA